MTHPAPPKPKTVRYRKHALREQLALAADRIMALEAERLPRPGALIPLTDEQAARMGLKPEPPRPWWRRVMEIWK